MDTSADAGGGVGGDAGVGTGDGLGSPGGDPGGNSGGSDGTDGISFGTTGQGDTDYSGSSTDRGGLGPDTGSSGKSDGGLFGAIFDALFGGPRTGDPVVDAALTGWLSAIPFAGPALALTNAARDRGYSVEAADLPDSPGADGYGGFSPYRRQPANLLAPTPSETALPAWFPQGGATNSPYLLPAPQAPENALAAASGETTAADPYQAPEKSSLPLLIVAAGVLAALSL